MYFEQQSDERGKTPLQINDSILKLELWMTISLDPDSH